MHLQVIILSQPSLYQELLYAHSVTELLLHILDAQLQYDGNKGKFFLNASIASFLS